MKELEINGYFTKVESEILDFLPLLSLTKRELEIMIVIIRLTNGFKKPEDWIPLSQFNCMTRISKGDCSRTIAKLISRKMIYKTGNILGINRDFSQWKGVVNLTTHKGLLIWTKKVVNSYNKKVVNLRPSKETLKETTKERVFSKLEDKENKRIIQEGLSKFAEAIGNFPKEKR